MSVAVQRVPTFPKRVCAEQQTSDQPSKKIKLNSQPERAVIVNETRRTKSSSETGEEEQLCRKRQKTSHSASETPAWDFTQHLEDDIKKYAASLEAKIDGNSTTLETQIAEVEHKKKSLRGAGAITQRISLSKKQAALQSKLKELGGERERFADHCQRIRRMNEDIRRRLRLIMSPATALSRQGNEKLQKRPRANDEQCSRKKKQKSRLSDHQQNQVSQEIQASAESVHAAADHEALARTVLDYFYYATGDARHNGPPPPPTTEDAADHAAMEVDGAAHAFRQPIRYPDLSSRDPDKIAAATWESNGGGGVGSAGGVGAAGGSAAGGGGGLHSSEISVADLEKRQQYQESQISLLRQQAKQLRLSFLNHYNIDNADSPVLAMQYVDPDRCSNCHRLVDFDALSGLIVCPGCFKSTPFMEEVTAQPFNTTGTQQSATIVNFNRARKRVPSYKTGKNFSKWLRQFRKGEPPVPDSVIQEVKKCFDERYCVRSVSEVRPTRVKQFLKELGYREYQDASAYITKRLNNQPIAALTDDEIQLFTRMFKKTLSPFLDNRYPYRTNFLRASYVMNRMSILVNKPWFAKAFPLLKRRDSMRLQEKIWADMCLHNKWQFTPSH